MCVLIEVQQNTTVHIFIFRPDLGGSEYERDKRGFTVSTIGKFQFVLKYCPIFEDALQILHDGFCWALVCQQATHRTPHLLHNNTEKGVSEQINFKFKKCNKYKLLIISCLTHDVIVVFQKKKKKPVLVVWKRTANS